MPTYFDKIAEPERIYRSYKQTKKGAKKFRRSSIIFDMARDYKLQKLIDELKSGNYTISEYGTIYVREPKERIVHAPKLRDKIVQFAAHEVLQEIYKPVFIDTTYACIKERGTHDAVDKIQHYMRLVKWKYGTGYIIKIDIKKYFYSIDREILKKFYRDKIPAGEEDFINLLDMIVDSSPEPDGKGIPLGNVTSQDFANIVGNKIDQYVKRYLGIKYYVRFMDDMIIILPTKEEAQEALKCVIGFINKELHLRTNEKTKIFPLEQGVKVLGFHIYTTHRTLLPRTVQGMKRRIKAIDEKVKSGEMSEKQAQQEVSAWLGHARHANAYNLCKKIFEPYPYIKYEDPKLKFGERKKNDGERNNT